jgi:hypothetical protein
MKKKLDYLGYFWLIFKGDTNIYIYIYMMMMMKENPFNTNTSANFGKNIISMPAATHYQSPILIMQDKHCSHSLLIIVNCCIYIV